MSQLSRITRTTALFALAVLWSKAWGQLRDSMSAGLFPNDAVAAYNLALQVPFMAPQVITTTLMGAIVPVLVGLRRTGRDAEARQLSRKLLLAVFVCLSLLAAAGVLFARPLLQVIYFWNEKDPSSLGLAVQLSYPLYAYLLISGVAGAITASLQAFGRLTPLALGQMAPNVLIVGCMLALRHSMGIRSQALGVVLGGASYLLLLVPFYWTVCCRPGRDVAGNSETEKAITSIPAVNPDFKRAGRQIAEAILPLLLFYVADWGMTQLSVLRAVSAVQVSEDFAVKVFWSAYQVVQVPQGVFLSALAMPLLPHLSSLAAEGDRTGMTRTLQRGIRLVLFVVAPVVALLALLAFPLINILYRHGAYTQELARSAAPLVSWMAASVLIGSVADVFVLTLLALQDYWLLLLVQGLSFGLSSFLTLAAANLGGLPGVALAVSVVAAMNLWLLSLAVRRRLSPTGGQELGRFLGKLLLATLALCLTLGSLQSFFSPPIGTEASLLRVLALSAIGIGVYAAAALGLQMEELRELVSTVLRRAARAKPD